MRFGMVLLTTFTFLVGSVRADEPVIPHFGQHAIKTLIRLTHPGTETESVVLRGFDASGQAVGQKTVTLAPGTSQTLNAAQLGFLPAWLRIEDQDQIRVGAVYKTDHPRSVATGVPASKLRTNLWRLFPKASTGRERLFVVNTGYRTTEVVLTLKRFSDGAALNSHNITLSAGEKGVINLHNAFGNLPENEAMIDIAATEPLSVLALSVSKNRRVICENRALPLGPPELIQQIELLGDFLFPEGIAIDQRSGAIYTGGLGNGEIQKVVDGTASVFATAASGLVSVTGMTVDEDRNLLFVCNSDFFFLEVAEVVVFDLATGQVVARFAVPDDGRFHFMNDITLDTQGNAYVTDSFAPIIWRVASDLSGMQIYIEDEELFGIRSGFNLNGITVTPDDRFLITAIPASSGTTVYRIDITSREVIPVSIEGTFVGGDGLVFRDDRRMLSVLFDITQLTFDCDFSRATVQEFLEVSTHLDGATTGKIFDNRLYVVNSQLDHLIFEDGLQETFTLTSVPISILE